MIKIVSVEGHSEVLEFSVTIDMEDNMNDATINDLCSPSTYFVMEPILHVLNTPTSRLNEVDDKKKNGISSQNSKKVNDTTMNSLYSPCASFATEETGDRKENDRSLRKILHHKPTRLKHTSVLADKHGIYLDKKLLLKEKYYEQKIALMSAPVDVEARKAYALERIADALENL